LSLTKKQQGVLRGMLIGLSISIAVVAVGVFLNPLGFHETLDAGERAKVASAALILPGFFLIISVGRLAKHRFTTPEDIDGSGLTSGTEQAKLLQSLLQNSLEQFCIAVAAYLGWAAVMPATWLSVIPLAASAFFVGRVLFFAGYKNGAPARALGFTLTFYPSVLMFVCTVVVFLQRALSAA
jgi:uncharacterized membrane protein YecN with MAPEG domain